MIHEVPLLVVSGALFNTSSARSLLENALSEGDLAASLVGVLS